MHRIKNISFHASRQLGIKSRPLEETCHVRITTPASALRFDRHLQPGWRNNPGDGIRSELRLGPLTSTAVGHIGWLGDGGCSGGRRSGQPYLGGTVSAIGHETGGFTLSALARLADSTARQTGQRSRQRKTSEFSGWHLAASAKPKSLGDDTQCRRLVRIADPGTCVTGAAIGPGVCRVLHVLAGIVVRRRAGPVAPAEKRTTMACFKHDPGGPARSVHRADLALDFWRALGARARVLPKTLASNIRA